MSAVIDNKELKENTELSETQKKRLIGIANQFLERNNFRDVSQKRNVEYSFGEYQTPLSIAFDQLSTADLHNIQSRIEIIHGLLLKGASITQAEDCAMHKANFITRVLLSNNYCLKSNALAIIKILVEAGKANLDDDNKASKDATGVPPVVTALKSGHIDVLEYFAKRGANVSCRVSGDGLDQVSLFNFERQNRFLSQYSNIFTYHGKSFYDILKHLYPDVLECFEQSPIKVLTTQDLYMSTSQQSDRDIKKMLHAICPVLLKKMDRLHVEEIHINDTPLIQALKTGNIKGIAELLQDKNLNILAKNPDTEEDVFGVLMRLYPRLRKLHQRSSAIKDSFKYMPANRNSVEDKLIFINAVYFDSADKLDPAEMALYPLMYGATTKSIKVLKSENRDLVSSIDAIYFCDQPFDGIMIQERMQTRQLISSSKLLDTIESDNKNLKEKEKALFTNHQQKSIEPSANGLYFSVNGNASASAISSLSTPSMDSAADSSNDRLTQVNLTVSPSKNATDAATTPTLTSSVPARDSDTSDLAESEKIRKSWEHLIKFN